MSEDENFIKEVMSEFKKKIAAIPESLERDITDDAIEAVVNLIDDRDEWKQQHENLLSVRQSDLQVVEQLQSQVEQQAAKIAKLEERIRVANAEEPVWFPLLGTGLALRWSMLNEAQAKRNHGQSLRRLAERGGLDPQEASAVINYRDWEARKHRDLKDALQALLIPQPTMPNKGE